MGAGINHNGAPGAALFLDPNGHDLAALNPHHRRVDPWAALDAGLTLSLTTTSGARQRIADAEDDATRRAAAAAERARQERGQTNGAFAMAEARGLVL